MAITNFEERRDMNLWGKLRRRFGRSAREVDRATGLWGD